jgi:excisionase family DNA binding protein
MFLKVSEVAVLLRVSKTTVHKLLDQGLLSASKLSPRGTRVTKASVDAFLQRASNGEVTLPVEQPRA